MKRKAVLLLTMTVFLVLVLASPALAISTPTTSLQVGSRGPWVTELQYMLKKNGFFPAAQNATGYYGWITYNAVTSFEKKYGLKPDGKLSPYEWKVLAALNPPKVVLGYYVEDYPGDKLSYNSLAGLTPGSVDQAAMFGYFSDGSGNLRGSISTQAHQLARQKGSSTLMVVHNIKNGTYDKQAAIDVVSQKTSRNNLINNIVSQLDKYKFDGVNIDLEGLPVSCKAHFNNFLEELNAVLKAKGKLLTVAIPAKTDDKGNAWSAAYDYKTIGYLADYIVIMAYDEHWFGGPPGPVASLPWVNKVMDYAVSTMPSQKVLMGVGCYGYDWPAWGQAKTVRWKDVQALAAANGPIQWHNYYSVPFLKYYKNGVLHQVWFENSYSLAIKLNLVNNKRLGGIALWRLGFEDNSLWNEINKVKNKGVW